VGHLNLALERFALTATLRTAPSMVTEVTTKLWEIGDTVALLSTGEL